MKTAMFVNFTTEPFVAYWNGKAKKFAPGKGVLLEEGIARHHAKHLANQELIRMGHETKTSPKSPKDVPEFQELFDKAFQLQEDEDDDQSQDEANTKILNQNAENVVTEKSSPTQASAAPAAPHAQDGESDDEDFGPAAFTAGKPQ